MKILSAAVITTLGSSLGLNAGALLANESCYTSGTNSEGFFYPYTSISVGDENGFKSLGFGKVKVLIESLLSDLYKSTNETEWEKINTAYFIVSSRFYYIDMLEGFFRNNDFGIKIILVKGDGCTIIEVLDEIKDNDDNTIIIAYDNLNESSVLSELFSLNRVKHSNLPEGTIPGEAMCGVVVGNNDTLPALTVLGSEVEIETSDSPGKIIRANALVKAIKSVLDYQDIDYHELSLRFADLNGESQRSFESAIANTRLQKQPMIPKLLSLNTVTPCGDVGCASGLLQLALLFGAVTDEVLRSKIALRAPSLALHQIYGEKGRRGVLLSRY